MTRTHTEPHTAPELVTVAEASERLLGSRRARAIRRALCDGELDRYMVDGYPRVRWVDVLAWARSQRVRPRNREHARSVVEARLAHEAAR